MKTFEQLWANLQTNMRIGTEIKNWTAANGYLGDKMTVVNVSNNMTQIEAPKAKNIQSISKSEFEKVWGVWSEYINKKMPRHELRDITHFSKYIISILFWLDKEC